MRLNKLIIILSAIFLPFLSMAQTDMQHGIKFESGLNWQQILAKAKAENKYIFVDCYATWCGPCKWMSVNIFPNKEVGDYMNGHFVNVAVQMDKTTKDDQLVKNSYGDASRLNDLYKIGSYPTYLFFSPDGIALHRFTGSRENVKTFLDAVKDAFNPVKQYYGLVKQWSSHKSDTTLLFNAYTAARGQRDYKLADSIGEAYLNAQSELLTMKNLRLITSCNLIRASNDKWFQLFLTNAAKINTMAKDSLAVSNNLSAVVFREEITLPFYFDNKPLYWNIVKETIRKKYPVIGEYLIIDIETGIKGHIHDEINTIIRIDKKEPDWGEIAKKLEQKYPDFNLDLALTSFEVEYYAHKKLWPETADAVYQLMTKYGDQVSDSDMNSIIWDDVVMHVGSPKILTAAQKIMSDILKNSFKAIYVDTYANILYKLGKRDEALTWETKAIETSIKNNGDPSDLNDFKTNLAKMQQGQPTWAN